MAIGATLTAIHIMALPVSNASVNPARSLGNAVLAEDGAQTAVSVPGVATILGGVIGGSIARWLPEDGRRVRHFAPGAGPRGREGA